MSIVIGEFSSSVSGSPDLVSPVISTVKTKRSNQNRSPENLGHRNDEIKGTGGDNKQAILEKYSEYLEATVVEARRREYRVVARLVLNRIEQGIEGVSAAWDRDRRGMAKRFERFLRRHGFLAEHESEELNRGSTELLLSRQRAFLNHLRVLGMDEATIRTYTVELRSFSKYAQRESVETLGHVSSRFLENYKTYLLESEHKGRRISHATKVRKIHAVKRYFAFLVNDGAIAFNPARGLKMRARRAAVKINFVSHEVMRDFLDSIPTHKLNDHRNKVLFETAYLFGLRVSEVSNLKIEDLDFSNRIVWIRQGKGRVDRTLPMPSEFEPWIRHYTDTIRARLLSFYEKGAEVNFLFPTFKRKQGLARQGRIASNVLQANFRFHWKRFSITKKAEENGVPSRLTFHAFRYSFSVNLLRRGLGIRYLQKLLGHRRIENTADYARVLTEDLRDVLRRFHPREDPVVLAKIRTEANVDGSRPPVT